jgi:hypothetical protein
VHASRALILAFVAFFLVMIRLAWKRNGYDDRTGVSCGTQSTSIRMASAAEPPEPARYDADDVK